MPDVFMKIVMSHVYSSHNNGDAAILSAQLDELKRTFQGVEFRILSVDVIEPGLKFDGVPVSNALMYGSVSPSNGKLKKLWLAFAMIIYTTAWAAVFRASRVTLPLPRSWREPMRILAEADMQVCVGGGYLRAKNDSVSTIMLLLLFHQIWLAKVLGKPVCLYAQSFGPYPRRIQMRIASAGLRWADLILVREAKSKALLTSMGLAGERVKQVPDSAFMFEPRHSFDPRPLLGMGAPGEQVVGITVRAWLPGAQQRAYERAIAEFIDRASRRSNLRVVVIAQVTAADQNDDDRVVGRRIQALLEPRSNVVFLDQRFSHHEIKSVFANLNFLVGTRFHSVIFALTAGVPALAVEYEHKTSGIMQDLGLERWVLPIEDVTADNLTLLFDELEREQEGYMRRLRSVLPKYVADAAETGDMIEQMYKRSRHAPGRSSRQ
jgi:colanic acid/amylovoran biosynthesis protein